MNKRIIIGLLSIFIFNSIDLLGMRKGPSKKDSSSKPVVRKAKAQKLLPMNGIKIIIPQSYYGGKPVIKKKNDAENEYIHGELVDLSMEDIILKNTFVQLIKEKHKEELPYIFAVLLMKESAGKFARRYQDAGALVNWMFDTDTFKRIPGKTKHTITQQEIQEPINFFVWYPKQKAVEYLGSEEDAKKSNSFIQCLLRINAGKGNDQDFARLGDDFLRKKQFDLAEKYYLQAIKAGNNANNLAYIYMQQEKFDLAEKYYLQAIKAGNIYAMSNLIYLFAIGKTSKTTKEQIENYYQQLQQDKNIIDRYSSEHPERWKVIQSAMQND